MNQVDALIGLTHHALTVRERGTRERQLPDDVVGQWSSNEVQFSDGGWYRVDRGPRGIVEIGFSQEVEDTLHVWVR